jgi:S1-C subfamily serine protease
MRPAGEPPGAAVNELERQIEAVYAEVGPSVVNITSRSFEYDFFLNPVPREGSGSGFFFDDKGHIVTNFHVIEGAEEVQVALADGQNLPAQVVGRDPSSDLAVLKVELPQSASRPVRMGDASALKIGRFMVAIGNPFGLERTLTVGVVSSLGRVIESPNQRFIGEVIQTDAPINPGNSGGPLLNLAGEVVGVNSAILSPSGASAGIGFAIPAQTVMRVVPALIQNGHYAHPSLGADFFELNAQRADVFRRLGMNLPVDTGLLIVQVADEGAAARAGLRGGQQMVRLGGDIVTAVDGVSIVSERDLIVHLETRAAVGQTVQVTFYRDGSNKTVPVMLGEG